MRGKEVLDVSQAVDICLGLRASGRELWASKHIWTCRSPQRRFGHIIDQIVTLPPKSACGSRQPATKEGSKLGIKRLREGFGKDVGNIVCRRNPSNQKNSLILPQKLEEVPVLLVDVLGAGADPRLVGQGNGG